jgi:hypothetical protein
MDKLKDLISFAKRNGLMNIPAKDVIYAYKAINNKR